jgi:hypothetical protein
MSKSRGDEYLKAIHVLHRKIDLANHKIWLGHRLSTSIAKIDDMVLDGTSITEIAKKSHTSKEVVHVHLSHLRNEHGIPFKRENGKIMVDMDVLEKRVKRMKLSGIKGRKK